MIYYILDACALIALMRNEQGVDIMADAINEANNGNAEVVMHKANLLEVYYDLFRTLGKDKADEILAKIKMLPITINAEITDQIFSEAGRLKASYKVSYADTFALAQAILLGGKLITSDHHEFDSLNGIEPIQFHWTR